MTVTCSSKYQPVSSSSNKTSSVERFCSEVFQHLHHKSVPDCRADIFPTYLVSSLPTGHHLPAVRGTCLGSGFRNSWYFSTPLLKWDTLLLRSFWAISITSVFKLVRIRIKQPREGDRRNSQRSTEVRAPEMYNIKTAQNIDNQTSTTTTVCPQAELLLPMTRCMATYI